MIKYLCKSQLHLLKLVKLYAHYFYMIPSFVYCSCEKFIIVREYSSLSNLPVFSHKILESDVKNRFLAESYFLMHIKIIIKCILETNMER